MGDFTVYVFPRVPRVPHISICPNVVCLDLALGIPPNHGYIVGQYPFYATKDGKGRPVLDRLAYIAI
jgi:hypothetical protein